MEHTFWHDKWAQNQIGFHLPDIHPLLVRNLALLKVKEGDKIFVPLCGKTLDIGYFLQQGFSVVAVELSEIAVTELFAQLGLQAEVTPWQKDGQEIGKIYQAPALKVFVGDFFALTASDLGKVAAVYDRAALIALPAPMRADYSLYMMKITAYAAQLLITLSYDQGRMAGPPFSVSDEEVAALYGAHYPVQKITESDIIEHEPHFAAKGLSTMQQILYLLK